MFYSLHSYQTAAAAAAAAAADVSGPLSPRAYIDLYELLALAELTLSHGSRAGVRTRGLEQYSSYSRWGGSYLLRPE